MRVLASPAWRNRDHNAYTYLLSEALAAAGCEVVDDLGPTASRRHPLRLSGRWDIYHVHWPQQAARGPLPLALRRSLVLLARVLVQRLKGTRIVWTVHNVRGHDQNNARLEAWLMGCFVRLVHGVIFLTETSRSAAYDAMPALAGKPYAIVPHGLYGTRSALTRETARAAFGLAPGAPIVGFLGDIKPYKGLDLLLDALEEGVPGQVALFVAGRFEDPEYGAAVKDRLSALAAGNDAIVFREVRLDDATLADAIRACDAVALPYRATWNSGLALLIIENGRPILASDAPVFRELRDEIGAEWVHLPDGTMTADDLLAASAQRPREDSERMRAFEATRAWHLIGAETVAFYRRLIARRSSEGTKAQAPIPAAPGKAGHRE